MPVHNWFMRHVYYPLLRKGVSKSAAMLIVFLISALGHEYLVSGSLCVVSFWAFGAMMSQVPIMIIQKKTEKFLKSSQLGNVFFWIMFCFIGQPTCFYVYYYLYITRDVKQAQSMSQSQTSTSRKNITERVFVSPSISKNIYTVDKLLESSKVCV
eukprot:TRINITY_DN3386_c0_g1_i11.p2 TRINITY_DN3386_c0_g1~~TRINITY_DN3386_c0_g1_i11.p2  ORF type:complete len:155 (-),score=19.04 TRINITY_DN3386_c0_g1_i11:91-555(-)